MPDDAPAREALELGRAQLAALRSGDTDAYLAGEARYHAACTAAAAAAGGTPGDLLQDLASLHGAILAEVQTWLDAASRRMGGLSRGRRLAGAYAPGPAATPDVRALS